MHAKTCQAKDRHPGDSKELDAVDFWLCNESDEVNGRFRSISICQCLFSLTSSIILQQAVKNRCNPTLPVTFMDGSTREFEVDPATTCAELCRLIKEKLGVKNIFGFSMYVASLEQVLLNF